MSIDGNQESCIAILNTSGQNLGWTHYDDFRLRHTPQQVQWDNQIQYADFSSKLWFHKHIT